VIHPLADRTILEEQEKIARALENAFGPRGPDPDDVAAYLSSLLYRRGCLYKLVLRWKNGNVIDILVIPRG